MNIVGLLILLLSLAACSSSHNIDISKISEIEVTFSKNNKPIDTVRYGKNSNELRKIKAWLENNKNGWKAFIATVAINDLTIKGKGFTLNTSDNWVILNYDHGSGSYRQITKTINPNDFNFFTWPSYKKSSNLIDARIALPK